MMFRLKIAFLDTQNCEHDVFGSRTWTNKYFFDFNMGKMGAGGAIATHQSLKAPFWGGKMGNI